MRARTTIIGLALAVAMVAASCGGSSAETAGEDPDDGDVAANIQLQDEGVVVEDATTTTATAVDEAAADGAGGASEGEDTGETAEGTDTEGTDTEDTIPQNAPEEGAEVDDLFSAMNIFNTCLSDNGTAFIGAPNPEGEPTDPVNDPDYLKVLGECAAVSNIQEAFTNFSAASEGLTPEEVEDRNAGLVIWAECMTGRGWTLGELTPDDQGLLSPDDLTPPDGETVLGSDDLQECAAIAQAENDAAEEESSTE